jgi:diadenosine tetraphosphate (Ap4A) HIT family hydrolase
MTPKVATKKDSSYVIQAADPVVNGWLLLLPKERKEIMNKAGEIDELIFQAHMIIHA